MLLFYNIFIIILSYIHNNLNDIESCKLSILTYHLDSSCRYTTLSNILCINKYKKYKEMGIILGNIYMGIIH